MFISKPKKFKSFSIVENVGLPFFDKERYKCSRFKSVCFATFVNPWARVISPRASVKCSGVLSSIEVLSASFRYSIIASFVFK